MRQQRPCWTHRFVVEISISILVIFVGARLPFEPFPVLHIAPVPVEGASAIAAATPPVIALGQPTQVAVPIQLSDAQLIPHSVNLQQVETSGKVVAVLGTLNDDALNGDECAGDQLLTITHTFTETTATSVLLRVSWAVQGNLGRWVR